VNWTRPKMKVKAMLYQLKKEDFTTSSLIECSC